MSQSPSVIAAKDQMLAAVRDRFDRVGIDIYDPHDALTILCVVGIIADAVLAYPVEEQNFHLKRLAAVGFALEALVTMTEDNQ
tara:strand:+ start:535 stop:783 length:249 start_codon:yes stop_codon:yes gene_type:complete